MTIDTPTQPPPSNIAIALRALEMYIKEEGCKLTPPVTDVSNLNPGRFVAWLDARKTLSPVYKRDIRRAFSKHLMQLPRKPRSKPTAANPEASLEHYHVTSATLAEFTERYKQLEKNSKSGINSYLTWALSHSIFVACSITGLSTSNLFSAYPFFPTGLDPASEDMADVVDDNSYSALELRWKAGVSQIQSVMLSNLTKDEYLHIRRATVAPEIFSAAYDATDAASPQFITLVDSIRKNIQRKSGMTIGQIRNLYPKIHKKLIVNPQT